MNPQMGHIGSMNAFDPNGLRREIEQLSGGSGIHFREMLRLTADARAMQSLHLEGPQMYRCQGAALAYREILALLDTPSQTPQTETNLSGIV